MPRQNYNNKRIQPGTPHSPQILPPEKQLAIVEARTTKAQSVADSVHYKQSSREYRQTKNTAKLHHATVNSTWRAYANCVGENPDVFFIDQGSDLRPAKQICNACSVRLDCLDYAITTRQEFGFWGGTTPDERIRIQRKRARQARASRSTSS